VERRARAAHQDARLHAEAQQLVGGLLDELAPVGEEERAAAHPTGRLDDARRDDRLPAAGRHGDEHALFPSRMRCRAASIAQPGRGGGPSRPHLEELRRELAGPRHGAARVPDAVETRRVRQQKEVPRAG
jgi:hypothetical protein